MEKIRWTKELSLGIRELDDQHREIIKNLGDIVAAAQSGTNTMLLKLMKEANSGFAAHFAAEEKIMAASPYPDTAGHEVLHGEFMEEFEDLESRAFHGEIGEKFASEIKENAADWFILHIKKNDIKMASYIIRK